MYFYIYYIILLGNYYFRFEIFLFIKIKDDLSNCFELLFIYHCDRELLF